MWAVRIASSVIAAVELAVLVLLKQRDALVPPFDLLIGLPALALAMLLVPGPRWLHIAAACFVLAPIVLGVALAELLRGVAGP